MVTHRSPGIDALRGLSIIGVVGFHYWSYASMPFPGSPLLSRLFSNGPYGVDVFFVISGYLLGGQLIAQRGREGAISAFYVRRVARILPLYLLLLAMIWLAFPPANFWLLATDAHWSFGGKPCAWEGPTWSLAVEEQFYLLLPVLIWWSSPRRLPMVLVAIGTAALALRLALLYSGYIVAANASFPCNMHTLALGVLLAWMRLRGRLPTIAISVPAVISWVGRRSYAVYLFHLPLGDAVRALGGQGLFGGIAAFVLTLLLAQGLWLCIEAPAIGFAKDWLQRQAFRRAKTEERRAVSAPSSAG
jgi:peptidoglycan/LPS O-acetylase OafA/YrhL